MEEVKELLNAIVELTQSVARMPCPAVDKTEVLENVKTLFSCYNSIANALANSPSSSRENVDMSDTPSTHKKTKWSSGATPDGKEMLEIQLKLQDMDEKIFNLEKSHLDTRKVVSDLRSEFETNSSTTDQIKTTQTLISERISVIENKSNDFEDLKSQVGQVSRVLASRSMAGLEPSDYAQGEMVKLHQEIADLESLVSRTRGTQNFTAFAAETRGNKDRKYKAGDLIDFKSVLCNVNDCYSGAKSMFTNKSLGVYVFTSSINTNSAGDFEAAIVHNNEEVALFGTTGQKDLQTGTSIVLTLQPGDTVCVKVAKQSGLGGNRGVEIGAGFSNFIGYKVY